MDRSPESGRTVVLEGAPRHANNEGRMSGKRLACRRGSSKGPGKGSRRGILVQRDEEIRIVLGGRSNRSKKENRKGK